MLAAIGTSSPFLAKNCLLLGLKSAYFHASALCEEKRAHKFGSAFRDGHKDYVNYTKRKRRAAEKRDLLKWRCCEIHYGNFEELYWSCGMSRRRGLNHRNFDWNGPVYSEGYRKQKRSNPEASRKSSRKSSYEFWRQESFSPFWSDFFDDFRFTRDGPFQNDRKRTTGTSASQNDCSGDKKMPKEAPTVGSPSDRRTLGLPPSGSLTIEELKKAFRASALKWHPDRHEDGAKANAEARFKDCGAAYKSLLVALAKAG